MSTLDPKHNSRHLTEGPERAPARSYLHGIGFDAEALAKGLDPDNPRHLSRSVVLEG